MLEWLTTFLAQQRAKNQQLALPNNQVVEQKSTRAANERILRQFILEGTSGWTDRSYMALAREGYQKNVIAYRCVNAIATACAGIPIIIKIAGKEIEDPENSTNKLARMIMRPNPKQSYTSFMEAAVAYRLIGGNTYIHLLKGAISNTPYELTLFRPDRVEVVTGSNFEPIAFRYFTPLS